MTKNRTPAGYKFDDQGRVYPDPDSFVTAPVKTGPHFYDGELDRLDSEHEWDAVTGDNPVAELRAADAARVADEDDPQAHFGAGA